LEICRYWITSLTIIGMCGFVPDFTGPVFTG